MPAFSGQVPICMRCGGRDIRQQSSGDGLWPAGGEGIAWVCDGCGHIGAPLLVDPRETGTLERRWEAELARTADELDDETRTHGPPRPTAADPPRSRAFAIGFLALGLVFLLPGLIAVTHALVQGAAWAAVRTLVGTGWLVAIGVVLILVGVRLLARPLPPPRESGDGRDPGPADAPADAAKNAEAPEPRARPGGRP